MDTYFFESQYGILASENGDIKKHTRFTSWYIRYALNINVWVNYTGNNTKTTRVGYNLQ